MNAKPEKYVSVYLQALFVS